MKKTKIICSIGPSSNGVETLEKMAYSGMNVARINFSHATYEETDKVVANIRQVREKTHLPIAILWDTKGPEFRTGMVENDGIELIEGQTIRLVKKECLGTKERLTVNHPESLSHIKIGDQVLLENAKMRLEVISTEEDGITCKILVGGILGNRKSISVPGSKLDIPYVSDIDREDIKYACKTGGEYLAISFVSCPEDVIEIKKLLQKYHREDLQIICKIESDLGIQNLKEILEVSEGIMIARGDLGTEVESERLPIIQKEMIKVCRKMGKICVVATEMLETMMENNRPKRAETSDIANAVLDGTDAVMLSGETTIGKHPVASVQAMAKICEVTEEYATFDYVEKQHHVSNIPTAIASGVVESAKLLNAKLICATSVSGYTAKLISNLKPCVPILALCTDEKIRRSLALHWGVYPVVLPVCTSTDEILRKSKEKALEFMPLTKGDIIITTGGFPNTEEVRPTNLMKIDEIE